ncbi:type IV pilus modification protein PilV [Endozoicomonas sp. 8E]|uniref:type IV pilus modification protein PilV n=1 Tax=Endozoicomonas sp. 8E TaxID=3035692 RepID=UPI002938F832|nr:type IV pilus modification protein PilV [Endozoicomonas sp. 8E]WOG26418.1 type IV pilus modification protein PilV [Endozoicomonas sp. 8E]
MQASSKAHRTVAQSKETGFGLIEVLISVVIFMVGILGMAGMQAQAVRATQDSLQRSQAIWLANEMSERMKVNVQGVESGRYQSTAQTASSNLSSYCAGPVPRQCIANSCSADEMADFDVHDLMCRNARVSNQQLAVSCSASPCNSGETVSITLKWETRGGIGTLFLAQKSLTLKYLRQ